MSNYSIHVQKTKAGKFCVCFVSQYNGKLVLRGEPLNRRIHAFAIAGAIGIQMGVTLPTEVLPADHKWPKNSGPKKRFVVTAGYAYSIPSAKDVKKLSKKSPPHIKAWLGVPKKTKKK